MQETMSKTELKDWINFLYSDLLKDNICIGGYFFNIKQLKDFEKIKKNLDKKYKAILAKNSLRSRQVSKTPKNFSCSASKCAQMANLDNSDKLNVKITTKNKFNEKIEFPIKQEEFFYIYNELEKAKQDIEHFKNFLLEELYNEEIQEEASEFMYFINDYLQDLRNKFSGTSV